MIKNQEKKLKNQVPGAISSRTVVPHFALILRPSSSGCAHQCQTTRTDRGHITHDRASSQMPILAVSTLGTVVCLTSTTVRTFQSLLAITNSWFFPIIAM